MSHIGPVFIAGLILVAAGAVTVLIFAPERPCAGRGWGCGEGREEAACIGAARFSKQVNR